MAHQYWCFDSSARNPERLSARLRVLSEFDGVTWDHDSQELFVHELRSAGDYQGEDLSPTRGREFVGPLNKLGFCVAYASLKPDPRVRLTPSGRAFAAADTAEERARLLLHQLLKWQLDNPLPGTKGYDGWDIVPFVAFLDLLLRLEGLSLDETGLFACTIKRGEDLPKWADACRERREQQRRGGEAQVERWDHSWLRTSLPEPRLTKDSAERHRGNLLAYRHNVQWFSCYTGLVVRGGRGAGYVIPSRLQ